MPISRAVCIIDADHDMREVLARVVRSVGLTAEFYDSTTSFRERTDKSAAGCVLLHSDSRTADGHDLLSRLGAEAAGLPIFIIGDALAPGDGRGEPRRPVVLVDKPFDVRSLARAIHGAMQNNNEP